MTEIQKKQTEDSCCCPPSPAPDRTPHKTGCLLCGKPLRYFKETKPLRCAICGKEADANCTCEDGHFVCDNCHESSSIAFFVPLLLASAEKDPLELFERVIALRQVHMHGPEHHIIVPCVLLTAYRNNGGAIDLEPALKEAVRRASQVPGGTCGYWGVCGAAAGAGIYMSTCIRTPGRSRSGSSPTFSIRWPTWADPAAASAPAASPSRAPRPSPRSFWEWRCRSARSHAAISMKTGNASSGIAPISPRVWLEKTGHHQGVCMKKTEQQETGPLKRRSCFLLFCLEKD